MRLRGVPFIAMVFCGLGVYAPAAAGEPAPKAGGAAPELKGEIVIGATFPLSGFLENYGQSAYFGANARVRIINANGGVNGKKLVLEWRDNRSNEEQAIRDVEELVTEHHVPAILGPLMSDAALAVGPLVKRLKVVAMTPMAAVNSATLDNEWMFRSCFNNTDMAKSLARFQMESYGAKTCAILYDARHVYTNEAAGVFEAEFTKMGGRVLMTRSFARPGGDTDFAGPLKELAETNPDFIFAPCYVSEATEMIYTARDLNIKTRFCGTHTWDIDVLFDSAGSRLVGTAIASALFEQSFRYLPFQTFFAAMEEAGMDNPDVQAACAYDAVSLLAEAMKRGETPEDIRQGFNRIKSMPLATGRTSISPEGNAIKPVIVRVVERRKGHLVPVFAARYDP